MRRLLDDQPVARAGDKLGFDPLVTALEQQVLRRDSQDSFRVGLFGPPGTGKTSLLRMLAERMREDTKNRWCLIEISSWLYREPGLWLPLLAAAAEQQPAFERLLRELLEQVPVETAKPDFGAKAMELPSLNMFRSFGGGEKKTLPERLAEAVRQVTENGERLVFFIEDLDRCPNTERIIDFLEHLSLFPHHPGCLFFITADRVRLVDALTRRFGNEGNLYLDKFLHLALDIPPADSHCLVDLLAAGEDKRFVLLRVAETLDGNPRRLKRLWNRAVLNHALLHDGDGPSTLPLMLKWLLLKESGLFERNPLDYLELERLHEIRDVRERRTRFEHVLKVLGFHTDGSTPADNNASIPWRNRFFQRLAVYLWQDLDSHRFESPGNLMRYVRATGQPFETDRRHLESHLFEGRNAFRHYPLKFADLRQGAFPGAHFLDCDLEGVDFSGADLRGAVFENCDLTDACFDGALLIGASWRNCRGFQYQPISTDDYQTNGLLDPWQQESRTLPFSVENELAKIHPPTQQDIQPVENPAVELLRLVEQFRKAREETKKPTSHSKAEKEDNEGQHTPKEPGGSDEESAE